MSRKKLTVEEQRHQWRVRQQRRRDRKYAARREATMQDLPWAQGLPDIVDLARDLPTLAAAMSLASKRGR